MLSLFSMDPFDLNLRHLHALRHVAEHGSMTSASVAAGMSQPALTQGLARMERTLGVTLFERRPEGARFTDAGRVLAERAQAAIDHLEAAARDAFRGGSRGFARPVGLMTSTQLRAFLSVADAGSFVGASAETGLSEPALHRAVRDLEQICGTALAERRGRGIQFTAPGRRLARGVRLAAAELIAARIELDPQGREVAQIVVGTMPLARARVLPKAIAGFVRADRKIPVKVIEGSWRELVEPLRDGVIDMMIGAMRAEITDDLAQEPLFEDELAIVARAGHPLASGPPSLGELASFDWIVSAPGTPLREHWDHMFAGRAPPSCMVECGSTMVIRGVLEDSDLLTLLSPDQVTMELAANSLIVISGPPSGVVRRVGLVTRAGWRPTAAQASFIDYLKEAATKVPKKL